MRDFDVKRLEYIREECSELLGAEGGVKKGTLLHAAISCSLELGNALRDAMARLDMEGRRGLCCAVDRGGYRCELPLNHDGIHRSVIGCIDEEGDVPEVQWIEDTNGKMEQAFRRALVLIECGLDAGWDRGEVSLAEEMREQWRAFLPDDLSTDATEKPKASPS